MTRVDRYCQASARSAVPAASLAVLCAIAAVFCPPRAFAQAVSIAQVSGQVTDWRKGQVSFSSLRGLKLRLYYRHKGSTAWHYYKAAKVGSHGLFHFSEAKSQGYYFKVRLPAQGPFLSCGSRTL